VFTRPKSPSLNALLRAALALPIVPMAAKAGMLEGASAGMRWQDYREDGGRMHISEPLLWIKSPLGDDYEIFASGVVDSISGASPRLVSNQSGVPVQTLSGASIVDRRRAADVKLARRFEQFTISLARAVSSEKDYESHAGSIEAKLELNEKNTTLVLVKGMSNDRVGSVDNPALWERRDTREYLIGVTQLLSPVSLLQSNVSLSRGTGFYNDPYKFTLSFPPDGGAPILFPDRRPAERDQAAWLTRYRHYFRDTSAALQAEYRFFRDTWGIRAHTLEAAWNQSLSDQWKIVPSLRYYSQSSADFYRPVVSRPVPETSSSDQRLAAFGGFAPGIKAIYAFGNGTIIDASYTLYRQRAGWKWGGGGSAEFVPLDARFFIVGVAHQF
jgi:hypothetical protein